MSDVCVVTRLTEDSLAGFVRHLDSLMLQRSLPREWLLWGDEIPAESVNEQVQRARELGVRTSLTGGRDLVLALQSLKSSHAFMLDASDWLAPRALSRVRFELDVQGDVDILYGDEVMWPPGGDPVPIFRPAWNPLLEESRGIVGECPIVRLGDVEHVAQTMADSALNKWGDYALRLDATTRRIMSVPSILVNRAKGSVNRQWTPTSPHGSMRLSLVVPTIGTSIDGHKSGALVGRMLRSAKSMMTRSTKLQVIVVCDEGTPGAVVDEVKALSIERLVVLPVRRDEGHFSFPQLMNRGAIQADGDLLIFANDDLEFIESDWHERLVDLATRSDVGVIGATLLYPAGTVQHAGMTVQFEHGGLPIHNNVHRDLSSVEPPNELAYPRQVHAVTGALMAVRRESFIRAGGFATQFPSDFNDVDLCWKLQALGLGTVIDPTPLAVHHESSSRTRRWESDRVARLQRRWGPSVYSDPWRNPNIAHEDWAAKVDWSTWERGSPVSRRPDELPLPVGQSEIWGVGDTALIQRRSERLVK